MHRIIIIKNHNFYITSGWHDYLFVKDVVMLLNEAQEMIEVYLIISNSSQW